MTVKELTYGSGIILKGGKKDMDASCVETAVNVLVYTVLYSYAVLVVGCVIWAFKILFDDFGMRS